ncbi:type IV pilus modification PilV family protein [Bacillus pinisoli]|uniref:type IV pilus modification PilV family protein n=1 Tax=Bacillus pinisoli TaxID=2901866 RepID=UPI001FF3C0E0|nr:prepilin-type N-terminal cleavage/methylation domain-containing protein [Bacillus pinisoli]
MLNIVKSNSKGFTLLEVLVSITILSIVLITLLAFFTQAYSFTNINKDKTVALNIARSVVTYIEKQNFQYLQTFLEEQVTASNTENDEKGAFVRINGESCDNRININKNGQTYNFSLFQETSSCELVLTPTINGRTYNSDEYFVTVKLRPTPLLPSGDRDPLTDYLLHFDVEVNWGSSAPILIKGVVSNEIN